VVIATGTSGDIFPFLKLAVDLVERGNRVTFLGPESYQEYILEKGVFFHSIYTSEEFNRLTSNPDLWHRHKGLRIVLEAISSRFELISDFVKYLPMDETLIFVCHPLALPSASLVRADRNNIFIVGGYLAPSNIRSSRNPMMLGSLRIPRRVPLFLRHWFWQLVDRYFIDPYIIPELNKIRKEKELSPALHFIEYMQSVPDLTVTFFPCWFTQTKPDWPHPICRLNFPLYDPNSANRVSTELHSFLALGEPPIIFTLGTANRHAAKFFQIAVYASSLLGKRAVLLTKYPELIPISLPNSVIWQEYVPLNELLPKAAILVHHGGIGTTAEALRAGIPQLIIPLAFDQFDNAACVEMLGAGLSLSCTSLQTNKLVEKLKKLFSSKEINAQCKLITSRFSKGNDIDIFCNAIEELMSNKYNMSLKHQLLRSLDSL
jgi:rhamnosyltransferase subunit B